MQIHPSQKKGFTLVELLVVIAIVATLAGLAVVGTRTALRAATATKTVNNMKSIGTIVESFVIDGLQTGGNNPPGTFPPFEGTLSDEDGTEFIWWELVAEQMTVAERVSGRFDWSSHPKETKLQNPLSEKKLGGQGSFTSFQGAEDTRGGFAYNARLAGVTEGETDMGAFAAANLEDGPNTIVFAESDDDGDEAGYYFTGVNSAPKGNFKEGAHCYFYGNSVIHLKNSLLSEPRKLEFLMAPADKDYSNRPE